MNAKMTMFFLPIRTFEHCFAALASLIVALALSSLYDLLQGKTGRATCWGMHLGVNRQSWRWNIHDNSGSSGEVFSPFYLSINFQRVHILSRKLIWQAGKFTMNEDVFPIEHGDFPASHDDVLGDLDWSVTLDTDLKTQKMNSWILA